MMSRPIGSLRAVTVIWGQKWQIFAPAPEIDCAKTLEIASKVHR